MPSSEDFDRLWNLSDNVLYAEAVAFMQRFVNEKGSATLPASQVTGLLNVSNAATYKDLERFIQHQRERNWPVSKRDIETFYAELEEWLISVKNRRLKDEFHLVREGQGHEEIDELMGLLAHDFIQHLVAENGVLAVKIASTRAKRK